MRKVIFNLLFTVSILGAVDGGWYIGASKETKDSSPKYKLGYLREDNSGRFEVYYHKDNLGFSDTATVGLRGENTFLPFGESSTIQPFFSGGFGAGSEYFDYLIYEFGIGVHYFVHKNIDISGGFFWESINMFGEDSSNNNLSRDSIEFGINYQF